MKILIGLAVIAFIAFLVWVLDDSVKQREEAIRKAFDTKQDKE